MQGRRRLMRSFVIATIWGWLSFIISAMFSIEASGFNYTEFGTILDRSIKLSCSVTVAAFLVSLLFSGGLKKWLRAHNFIKE